MDNRRRVRNFTLAVSTAVLALAATCSGPIQHTNGAGPLTVGPGETDEIRVSVYPGPDASAYTFGSVDLCVDDIEGPVELREVRPTKTFGSLPAEVNVRKFDERPGQEGATGIISAPGAPPDLDEMRLSGSFEPVSGAVIDLPCAERLDGHVIELLVTFTDSDRAGGGWQGFEIEYSAAMRTYVLAMPWHFYVCGAAVEGTDMCRDA